MNAEIIVALVTGAFTLAGVVLTVVAGSKKTAQQIKAQTDLTLYRIQELEKKQDRHNTLIERMYAAEEDIKVLRERFEARQEAVDVRLDNIEHRAS